MVNRSERGTENRSELSVPPCSGMALNRADTLRKDAAWVAMQLESPRSRALGATQPPVSIARFLVERWVARQDGNA